MCPFNCSWLSSRVRWTSLRASIRFTMQFFTVRTSDSMTGCEAVEAA